MGSLVRSTDGVGLRLFRPIAERAFACLHDEPAGKTAATARETTQTSLRFNRLRRSSADTCEFHTDHRDRKATAQDCRWLAIVQVCLSKADLQY